MAQQSMSTSPARNTSRAISAGGATKQGIVSAGTPHASTSTASNSGKAPVASGSSVQGFSGSGTLKAYIK